jgi:hypothetical protein
VDARGIRDVKVLVNNRPVKNIRRESRSKILIEFGCSIPLNKGKNEVKIIAVDEESLAATRVLRVTRVDKKPDVYVLVIGIGKYQDQAIPELPYAEDDAKAVYDFYHSNPKSPAKPENLFLVAGNQAKSKDVMNAFNQFAEKASAQDTVICYYAGHTDIGAHPTHNFAYYLLPYDAAKSDLLNSAIELSVLRQVWDGIKSNRKVFIVEGVNRIDQWSADMVDEQGDSISGFEVGLGMGNVVMIAANINQKSLSGPEPAQGQTGHGLFTYFLLEGLTGPADSNSDGLINVAEMKSYLIEKVPAKAKEMGGEQNPVIRIQATGEIFLAK